MRSTNIDMQDLKKQLAEANESIENLKDNEKRLKETLGQTKTDLLAMEEAKRKIFRIYKIKHETCNNLRNELAKLRGPQWTDR